MKYDKNTPKIENVPFVVSEAYSYYLKGLTAKETAILCKVSPRTVQRWVKEYEFKKMATPTPVKIRCFELSKQGFSYTQIARQLKVCKSTVYNYIREMKGKTLPDADPK